MTDIDARAKRAGEAARTEAAARVRDIEVPGARSPSRRHVRPLAGVASGLLALLLVVVVIGQVTSPDGPVIDAAVPDLSELVLDPVALDGSLPVPPVGDAIPAYLADGTPVFVSQPEPGEVFVLVAFDGHGAFGIHEMVHWCPPMGWFEEARHSTRFNAYGDYTGGPAPYALVDVPSELAADEDTVRVTGPPAAPRDRADVRAEVSQRGPNCLEAEGALTDLAVGHARPDQVPALDGSALPQGRWVWAQVRLGGPEGDPRVCELDGRCPASAPRFASADRQVVSVDPAELVTVLVRGDGATATLAVGPDPTWSHVPSAGPATRRSLPIPRPGHVGLEQLEDGTPVVVTHDADGQLHVLDATVPGQPALVGRCREGGHIADVSGATWTFSGAAVGGPEESDLLAYPFEVLEDGEAQALRVTGPVGAASARAEGETGDVPDRCTDGLEGHRPPAARDVPDRLSAATDRGDASSWVWVWTRLAEVDDQLVVCVYLGPDGCGEPVPTDETTADCYGDLPTGGHCADRDPVVVTPGLSASEEPGSLLVRLSEDGSTAEVRLPSTTD